MRGGRRHFLYSKLMCWVAVDRAIEMATDLGATDRVGRWERARDEIREAILRDGWSDAAGAFTQSFGSVDLDASVLMMPIVGSIPSDDPRMLATLDAIAERHPLSERRRARGGRGELPALHVLARAAQALAGRLTDARATFERAAGYASDLGLLSEEVTPRAASCSGTSHRGSATSAS